MCKELCDRPSLNCTCEVESDVYVPLCLASDLLCAACFLGFGPVGLCALRLHSGIAFNHIAISLFPQRNPDAK